MYYHSIEEVDLEIKALCEKFHFLVSYEIEEKTISILKARIIFSTGLFIQVYVNIRRPKISYSLIFNELRLYGRDFLWEEWHRHPFDSPENHDDSEEGRKEISIEEFFMEVLQYLDENDLL
jgi:hypothetical protein